MNPKTVIYFRDDSKWLKVFTAKEALYADMNWDNVVTFKEFVTT